MLQNKIKNILEETEKSFKVFEEITRKPEVNDEANIRQLLSDEHEAVSKYQKFADDTKDERVRKVLLDIKGEEVVHSGELTELLKILGINDEKEFKQGEEEVQKTLKEGLVEGRPCIIKENYLTLDHLMSIEELLEQKLEPTEVLQKCLSKYYPTETLTEEEKMTRTVRIGKELLNFGEALASITICSVGDMAYLMYNRLISKSNL